MSGGLRDFAHVFDLHNASVPAAAAAAATVTATGAVPANFVVVITGVVTAYTAGAACTAADADDTVH